MKQHSKAPWTVRTLGADCFVQGAETVGVVAGRPYHREIMGDEHYPEKAADAALIAAAPDLLEALESALKTAEFEHHPFRPWHQQARDAINKAKSEEGL